MAKKQPVFDYHACMVCRVCVLSCPVSSLDDSKTDVDRYRKAYPEMGRLEDCTGCGICASSCPVDAISMVERS